MGAQACHSIKYSKDGRDGLLLFDDIKWPQALCETQLKSPSSILGFACPLLHCAFPTFALYR